LTTGRHWTEWLIIIVAVITLLSGMIQLVLPAPALTFMNLTASEETIYLFRLVSLLTALFGGALLQTSLSGTFELTVLLWSSLQKVLGAVVVLLAILNGLIASGTLLIASYDFLAGLFVFWFYNRRK
jgi:hypothetical protein